VSVPRQITATRFGNLPIFSISFDELYREIMGEHFMVNTWGKMEMITLLYWIIMD
jgi:hypothetical protein